MNTKESNERLRNDEHLNKRAALFMKYLSIVLIVITSCLFVTFSASAQENTNIYSYPDYVIEIPQGTEIEIDEDAGVVTIVNNPVEIKTGDTFIVYLQDLPIGYVAGSVAQRGNKTYVAVEKADGSVYELLNEEGVVELTSDIYDFIPAENVTYSIEKGSAKDGGIYYADGALNVEASLEGCSVHIQLSNLNLYFIFIL